jgi:hypothetical protein
MSYQLKGGEEIRDGVLDGVLFGWTGAKCKPCHGIGYWRSHTCNNCGGTGSEWGRMPVQPPEFICRAMLHVLRKHPEWNGSDGMAFVLLSRHGYTAAEVIEYAPEAIKQALGNRNEHNDQGKVAADGHAAA